MSGQLGASDACEPNSLTFEPEEQPLRVDQEESTFIFVKAGRKPLRTRQELHVLDEVAVACLKT
ncbi:MAG: hypothetical protein WCQ48_02720 [Chloroflexota bacterium]